MFFEKAAIVLFFSLQIISIGMENSVVHFSKILSLWISKKEDFVPFVIIIPSFPWETWKIFDVFSENCFVSKIFPKGESLKIDLLSEMAIELSENFNNFWFFQLHFYHKKMNHKSNQ